MNYILYVEKLTGVNQENDEFPFDLLENAISKFTAVMQKDNVLRAKIIKIDHYGTDHRPVYSYDQTIKTKINKLCDEMTLL